MHSPTRGSTQQPYLHTEVPAPLCQLNPLALPQTPLYQHDGLWLPGEVWAPFEASRSKKQVTSPGIPECCPLPVWMAQCSARNGQGAAGPPWTPPECPQHAQSVEGKGGTAQPRSACPLLAGTQGGFRCSSWLEHTLLPRCLLHSQSPQQCWHSPPTQPQMLLNEGDQTH